MPGDLIISSPALEPAPKDTPVPPSTRYIVKQVQALYTDNGAGGAWLPTLEIVSDAGIVTGRYVGTSVAAGSDQEVTFHPLGSKGAASSPAAAAPNASAVIIGGLVYGGTDQLIGGHSSAIVTFLSSTFDSLDDGAGVYTWNNSQNRIETTRQGLFAAFFQTQFTADIDLSAITVQMDFTIGGGSSRAIWSSVDSASPPIGHVSGSMYGFDGTSATKVEVVQTIGFGYLCPLGSAPTAPSGITVLVNNNTAAGFTMTRRTLMIVNLQEVAIAQATFPAGFP